MTEQYGGGDHHGDRPWIGRLAVVTMVVALGLAGGIGGPQVLRKMSGASASPVVARGGDVAAASARAPLGLTCRLPVLLEGGSRGNHVGFVSFPEGRFMETPSVDGKAAQNMRHLAAPTRDDLRGVDWLEGSTIERRLRSGEMEQWFDVTHYLGPLPRPEISSEGATTDARFQHTFLALTPEGTPILRIGSRNPATPFSVIALTRPRNWTVLMRGVQGTPGAFDPTIGVTNANGVFFGNEGGPNVWHYSASSGLQKVATVIPPYFVRPTGPCT